MVCPCGRNRCLCTHQEKKLLQILNLYFFGGSQVEGAHCFFTSLLLPLRKGCRCDCSGFSSIFHSTLIRSFTSKVCIWSETDSLGNLLWPLTHSSPTQVNSPIFQLHHKLAKCEISKAEWDKCIYHTCLCYSSLAQGLSNCERTPSIRLQGDMSLSHHYKCFLLSCRMKDVFKRLQELGNRILKITARYLLETKEIRLVELM